MSKTDEKMERLQEAMYWEHHERLNALLFARLRTRTKDDVLQSLFAPDALCIRAETVAGKGIQTI